MASLDDLLGGGGGGSKSGGGGGGGLDSRLGGSSSSSRSSGGGGLDARLGGGSSRSSTRRKKKSGGGGWSLGNTVGAVGRIAKSVPSGVFHLGKSAVGEVEGWSDWAARGFAAGASGGRSGPTGESPIQANARALTQGEESEEYPLSSMFSASLHRTGHRVTHPGEYVEAFNEGPDALLGALLEDVGNVALVGGTAAKVLNTASAGRFAAASGARASAAAAEEGAIAAEKLAATTAAKAAEHHAAIEAAERALANTAKGDPNLPRLMAQAEKARAMLRDIDADVLAKQEAAANYRTVAIKAAAEADEALRTAGPIYRAYRVAHDVTRISNTGANLPFKPYQLAGRGISKATAGFLTKYPAVRQAFDNYAERVAFKDAVHRVQTHADERTAQVKQKLTRFARMGEGNGIYEDAAIAVAAGLGDAIAEPSRIVAQLGGDAAAGVRSRIDELAAAEGRNPEALHLAVAIAQGTADPAVAAKVTAMAEFYGREIVPILETSMTGEGAGRRRNPAPEQRARAEFNKTGTDLPPGARERVVEQMAGEGIPRGKKGRKGPKGAARLHRERAELRATATKQAERIGLRPGGTAKAQEARLGKKIAEERAARRAPGSVAKFRQAARAEGRLGVLRSSAERFRALRERIPERVPDEVVNRVARAFERITETTRKVQEHATTGDAPALRTEVRNLRAQVMDAVHEQLISTADNVHVRGGQMPFIPGDLSELWGHLHDELGIGEANLKREVQRVRSKLRGRAMYTTSDADLWVRAYNRLWRRLPTWAQGQLRKLDDAEVRAMFERDRNGTLTMHEGGLDEMVTEGGLSGAQGWVNEVGDENQAILNMLEDYARTAKLRSLEARAGRGGFAPDELERLTSSLMDDDVRQMLANPEMQAVLGARTLDDAVAALGEQRQALEAGAPGLDPEFPRRLEEELTANFPEDGTPDAWLQAFARAMDGVEGPQFNEFVRRWDAAGEPHLGALASDILEGAMPQLLQDQPAVTAGRPGETTLLGDEEARAALEQAAAESGGQALRPQLAREAGLAAAQAATAERVAGRLPGAQEAMLRDVAAPAAEAGIKAGKKVQKYQETLRKLGLVERQIEKLPDTVAAEIDRLYQDVTNVPSRARPAVIVARDFAKSLAEWRAQLTDDPSVRTSPELVRAIDDALTSSIKDVRDIYAPGFVQRVSGGPIEALPARFDPAYVQGGQLGDEGPIPAGGQPQRITKSLAHEEHVKRTAKLPRSERELRKVIAQRFERNMRNDTAREVEVGFTRRAEAVLGDTEGMTAAQVTAAMREQGFVPWDPESIFERPNAATTAEPTTLWLPENIARSMRAHFAPDGAFERAAKRFYDTPIRYWKAAVLALRPAWHVNNIVGNAIMAMVGGGMGPREYITRMRQANAVLGLEGARLDVAFPESATGRAARRTQAQKEARVAKLERRAAKVPEQFRDLPPEIRQRGQGASLGDDFEESKYRLGRLVARSYEVNGYVDDMNRIAVFLHGADKLADADLHRLVAKDPALAKLSPEQLRREGAMRLSLKAAGDFLRMTPFERRVIRRIVPFYAWMRHITKLTGHLARNHPMRLIWLAHLAEMAGDPQEFALTDSGILGPNSVLPLPSLNPFGDVASLNPADAGFNLTPAIRLGAGALFGFDTNRWAQFQRPPGEPGGYGGPTGATPLLNRPRELLNLIASQLPQTRVVRGVTDTTGLPRLPVLGDLGGKYGAPAMRYPLGQVRTSGGKPILTGEKPYGPLARYLGIPVAREPNLYERADVKQLAKAKR